MTNDAPALLGGCFCGKLRYSITPDGPPLLAAYCHCTRCQRLTGCPFVATVHIPPHVFSWAASDIALAEIAHEFVVIGVKRRYRCQNCGSGVASYNEAKNKWSIWAATLDRDHTGRVVGWDWAKPTDHQFYGTRILDVKDDCPSGRGMLERASPSSDSVWGSKNARITINSTT